MKKFLALFVAMILVMMASTSALAYDGYEQVNGIWVPVGTVASSVASTTSTAAPVATPTAVATCLANEFCREVASAVTASAIIYTATNPVNVFGGIVQTAEAVGSVAQAIGEAVPCDLCMRD